MGSLERTTHNLGFWQEFLLPISLYVVLRAGHAQFGILEGFLVTISLYVVLEEDHAQFGILAG